MWRGRRRTRRPAASSWACWAASAAAGDARRGRCRSGEATGRRTRRRTGRPDPARRDRAAASGRAGRPAAAVSAGREPVAQFLQAGLERGQGRAQLVGDVGGELAADVFASGPLRRPCASKARGHLAELAGGVERGAGGPVAGGEAVGGLGQRDQRPGEAAHDVAGDEQGCGQRDRGGADDPGPGDGAAARSRWGSRAVRCRPVRPATMTGASTTRRPVGVHAAHARTHAAPGPHHRCQPASRTTSRAPAASAIADASLRSASAQPLRPGVRGRRRGGGTVGRLLAFAALRAGQARLVPTSAARVSTATDDRATSRNAATSRRPNGLGSDSPIT